MYRNISTYFLLPIICVGTRTKTRTPIRDLEDRCTVRLCYASVFGAPARIRTGSDTGLKPAVYAVLLQARLVPPVGVEPTKDLDP